MTDFSIVLTGFMGTGKSSAGRLLAAQTGRAFVDTDELIARRAGKSVASIFEDDGEAAFRRREAALATELAGRSGLVIATGGGMMVEPANARLLARGNAVFCLQADPAEIARRLQAEQGARPLLTGEETPPLAQIEALLAKRREAYKRFTPLDTGDKTPDEVAAAIIRRLELAPPTHHVGSELTVPTPEGSYPVIIGSGLLSQAVAAAGSGPVAVIADSNVAPLYATQTGVEQVVVIPAGEVYKTLDTVRRLYDDLLALKMDRSGTIISLGGGVVGDVAGFVAATFMRGVRLVHYPTTLLAMVDASVGGKSGVDLPQGKNLVGAFKQPAAVFADVNTLGTLPPAEVAAGMAEVVKHGLIAAPSLLERLAARDWFPLPAAVEREKLIADAITVKRNVVAEDPYEQGRRAVLNLGHTFAHAVEQVSRYAISHGEAVAIGLVAAAHLSVSLGYAPSHLQTELEELLTHLSLPTRIPSDLAAPALLDAMGHDKKKSHGKLRFILLRAPGDVFIDADVPHDAVPATLQAITMLDESR